MAAPKKPPVKKPPEKKPPVKAATPPAPKPPPQKPPPRPLEVRPKGQPSRNPPPARPKVATGTRPESGSTRPPGLSDAQWNRRLHARERSRGFTDVAGTSVPYLSKPSWMSAAEWRSVQAAAAKRNDLHMTMEAYIRDEYDRRRRKK